MKLLLWPLLLLPLADLVLLFWIGRHSSGILVLLLVLGGFLLGTALLRRVTRRSVGSIQADLAAGRTPAGAVRDTLTASAAGLLLIFPGVLTDVLALLLLVPFTRAWLGAWLASQVQGHVDVRGFSGTMGRDDDEVPHDRVIDVQVIDPSRRGHPLGEDGPGPPGARD
jgi:UPF0716 protein FxsA